MNFWETKDWVEAKTVILKTEKLLSRIEYLKMVGSKNYSDEKYRQYLKVMQPTNQEGTPNDRPHQNQERADLPDLPRTNKDNEKERCYREVKRLHLGSGR